MTDLPRRVNYYTGMLLTADDLRQEFEYHRRMRYLSNRLHGHGVVDGLEVSVDEDGIHVSPGVAIDVHGREIVLCQPLWVDLSALPVGGKGMQLIITWAEEPEGTAVGPDGVEVNTHWVEQPNLALATPSKETPEALVLALLRRHRRGAVSVDPSVRRALRSDGDHLRHRRRAGRRRRRI